MKKPAGKIKKVKVKLKTVSYRLPVEVQRALNMAASEREIGKSKLVEIAIRRMLRLKLKTVAA